MKNKIYFIGPNTPTKSTEGSFGYDIKSNEEITLEPEDIKLIETGLRVKLPKDILGLLLPRSGLSTKDITILNSPGLIDSDYSEEIMVIIKNNSNNPYTIKLGDRIAQMIFIKSSDVEWTQDPYLIENFIKENKTRKGGFGSTGE